MPPRPCGARGDSLVIALSELRLVRKLMRKSSWSHSPAVLLCYNHMVHWKACASIESCSFGCFFGRRAGVDRSHFTCTGLLTYNTRRDLRPRLPRHKASSMTSRSGSYKLKLGPCSTSLVITLLMFCTARGVSKPPQQSHQQSVTMTN